MPKCNFCGKQIEEGTGKMFIKTDGKILHFDKHKCEKNLLKLKRDPKKFKWTKFYKK